MPQQKFLSKLYIHNRIIDELVKSQKDGKVKSSRCKACKYEGMRRTYRCAAVTEDAA